MDGGDDDHQHFGLAVHPQGLFHVGGGEGPGVSADVWFVEELTEIIVGTTETTVEDTRQGCLGIATVGTGMTASVLTNESEE